MKFIHTLTFILLLVGGLNWGLVGAFDFNLVDKILGTMPTVVKVVYILVGLSAIYMAATHTQHCKLCGKDDGGMNKAM